MIIEVKKIHLTGPKKELKGMIDALKSTGAFEFSSFKKAVVDAEENSESVNALNTNLVRAKTLIELIKKSQTDFENARKAHKKFTPKIESLENNLANPDLAKLKEALTAVDVMEYSELKSMAERESDFLLLTQTLEGYLARLNEIKSQSAKNKKLVAELKPYINLNVKLSLLHDTRETFILAGIIPTDMLAKFKSDFNLKDIILEEFESVIGSSCLVAIGHKEDYPLMNSIFSYKFERCKLSYPAYAKEKITELEEENSKLYYENLELLNRLCLNEEDIKLLKHYYDYLTNELETEQILTSILQTKDTYSLSGWIVGREENKIAQLVKNRSSDVAVKIEPALKNDNPPTLVKNRSLIAPYESITNLYSPPSSRDLDPNIFVAFFYFLFFGIMIGDVGYGILTFAVSLIIMLFFKPKKKGTKDLILIICMGGISAILWGFFFGSFFGLTKLDAGGNSTSLIPSVIDPVNDSLMFLIFTLALGVVQIVFGLMLKFYNLIRQKKVVDAICDAGFRIILFVGLVLFALNFAFDVKTLSDCGLYIAIGAVGLIFLTAGRKKKGFFGKLSGGFGGIYGLVNYFSDILSYARLFGLGLVGAVIAMVANLMGGMLFAVPVVGYPLGIIVMVFFHVFNLAIGLLSAYVHNARLQFVEFFGKFYEGGGREFTPLGSRTTYVKIKSILNKKEG